MYDRGLAAHLQSYCRNGRTELTIHQFGRGARSPVVAGVFRSFHASLSIYKPCPSLLLQAVDSCYGIRHTNLCGINGSQQTVCFQRSSTVRNLITWNSPQPVDNQCIEQRALYSLAREQMPPRLPPAAAVSPTWRPSLLTIDPFPRAYS